ncbi:unnamed protein product [Ectocarpus sp. 6 AP-2014]
MKTYSRLVVRFPADAVVDVEEIYAGLRDAYHIGYIALHDSDTHMSMYIQTASRDARMVPGKVLKICEAFGAQGQPATFSEMTGTPLTKIGVFRRHGHNTGKTGEEVIAATDRGKKTEPTRGKVYICIRARGDEDVSRISMQQFKDLLYSGNEELIDHVKQGVDETVLDNFIENKWDELQNELQVCGDDSDGASTIDDEHAAGVFSLPNIVFVNGEQIKFDPDVDSEYNRVARSTMENAVMSQLAVTRASYEIAIKFAGLLYANPHNNNVFITKKSGHIEFFDGRKWATQRARDADLVKTWQQMFKRCFALFEERSEDDWKGSFQRDFAEMLVKVFDNPMCFGSPITGERKDQRAAIDLVGENHARVVAVYTATGRKVVRVLSESHAECRGKTVLRDTTWGELMSV